MRGVIYGLIITACASAVIHEPKRIVASTREVIR